MRVIYLWISFLVLLSIVNLTTEYRIVSMIAENNSEVKLVKYFEEEKLNFLHFRQNLTMMRIQAQTQTMRMEGSWMTGGPY